MLALNSFHLRFLFSIIIFDYYSKFQNLLDPSMPYCTASLYLTVLVTEINGLTGGDDSAGGTVRNTSSHKDHKYSFLFRSFEFIPVRKTELITRASFISTRGRRVFEERLVHLQWETCVQFAYVFTEKN